MSDETIDDGDVCHRLSNDSLAYVLARSNVLLAGALLVEADVPPLR